MCCGRANPSLLGQRTSVGRAAQPRTRYAVFHGATRVSGFFYDAVDAEGKRLKMCREYDDGCPLTVEIVAR